MKIATWNVNSIRIRLEAVVQWLQETSVDVLCLQETKVVDEKFPRSHFEELGYHVYTSGQKSYNGVAILSRSPLADVSIGFAPILGENNIGELDAQKRVITGVIDGIRIVNLYVPNGAAVDSEKYYYKLHWLKVLREYLHILLQQPNQETNKDQENIEKDKNSSLPLSPSPALPISRSPLCVCGDFNIALEDRDIHDPAAYKGRIMASDVERQALSSILELGFSDAFRKFTTEKGHFSWWDYRTGAFKRNAGWRIDHHYLTPDLYEKAISCTIDKEPRKLPQPSDHTPVIVTISCNS